MPRPDNLESRGLRRAIIDRFADGAWHTLDEVVAACGHLIPPELAVRRAQQSKVRRQMPVREAVEHGRSITIRQTLRMLGAEHGGTGRMVWRSFRLAAGEVGTDYGQKVGSAAVAARLTETQVRQIRLRYALGSVTLRELGDEFDVCPSTISAVIRRQSWGHVA